MGLSGKKKGSRLSILIGDLILSLFLKTAGLDILRQRQGIWVTHLLVIGGKARGRGRGREKF